MRDFVTFRRQLALLICPELVELPPAAGQVAAPLQSLAELAPPNRARVRNGQARGDIVRRLDRLFVVRTGVVLTSGNWKSVGEAAGFMGAELAPAMHRIERLRSTPQTGIQSRTLKMIVRVFSEIWPADLDWPVDIPRPSKANVA